MFYRLTKNLERFLEAADDGERLAAALRPDEASTIPGTNIRRLRFQPLHQAEMQPVVSSTAAPDRRWVAAILFFSISPEGTNGNKKP